MRLSWPIGHRAGESWLLRPKELTRRWNEQREGVRSRWRVEDKRVSGAGKRDLTLMMRGSKAATRSISLIGRGIPHARPATSEVFTELLLYRCMLRSSCDISPRRYSSSFLDKPHHDLARLLGTKAVMKSSASWHPQPRMRGSVTR